MICERIKREIKCDTAIPSPKSKHPHLVMEWGELSGEAALAYSMPNHKRPHKKHVKKVTASEFNQAFLKLEESGEFRRDWYETEFKKRSDQAPCNFATIGGIFELLGEAEYTGMGVYKAK